MQDKQRAKGVPKRGRNFGSKFSVIYSDNFLLINIYNLEGKSYFLNGL